jgi:hypothetical protein
LRAARSELIYRSIGLAFLGASNAPVQKRVRMNGLDGNPPLPPSASGCYTASICFRVHPAESFHAVSPCACAPWTTADAALGLVNSTFLVNTSESNAIERPPSSLSFSYMLSAQGYFCVEGCSLNTISEPQGMINPFVDKLSTRLNTLALEQAAKDILNVSILTARRATKRIR